MAIQEIRTIKANILNLKKKDTPDNVWTKCPECNEIIYNGELDRNLRMCSRCNYYFTMPPLTRISFLSDEGSFHKYNDLKCRDMESCDEIIIGGKASLFHHHLVIMAVNIDPQFDIDDIFVSEKIISIILHSIKEKLPLLAIYTIAKGVASREYFSGQGLNISAAISKFTKENLPYISVLSQSSADSAFPTFAYLAEIIIAESHSIGTSQTGSRIGRRESESASNLLFKNGIVDMVTPREELRDKLADILKFFC